MKFHITICAAEEGGGMEITMDITIVLQQLLVLFAMMLAGYTVSRLGWISETSYRAISRIVVNVLNPALILLSVMDKSGDSSSDLFWQNLFLAALFYLFLFCVSYPITWGIRPEKKERPIYRMMTIFPNVGFMGIPLVSALLGSEYVLYVAVYMLFFNILVYSFGISLARSSRVQQAAVSPQPSLLVRLRPLLCNPGILSCCLAILFFFLPIPTIQPLYHFCNYMGNAAVPLSMMLIGSSIASSDLKSMLQDKKMYLFLLLRVLVLPILTTYWIHLLPVASTLQTLFVILLSMPVGSFVVLILEEYGDDADCAARGVVLSTLFSLLTLPVISLFL